MTYPLLKSAQVNVQTNTVTAKNNKLILHIPKRLIPLSCSGDDLRTFGSSPSVCHMLVNFSLTVSTPLASILVSGISEVITKMRIGITKQIAVIIYTSGVLNARLQSALKVLFTLAEKVCF